MIVGSTTMTPFPDNPAVLLARPRAGARVRREVGPLRPHDASIILDVGPEENAANRRWQNRQTQEWEEATSFFNVVCWGDMGENVGESIQKGARIVVTGRLEQRSWETDQGEKRSIVEIVADEVGPSLRWATAEVKKNDRRGPSDGGGGGGGGSSRPVANEPADAGASAGGGYEYG